MSIYNANGVLGYFITMAIKYACFSANSMAMVWSVAMKYACFQVVLTSDTCNHGTFIQSYNIGPALDHHV
jgi:hypothetical protein